MKTIFVNIDKQVVRCKKLSVRELKFFLLSVFCFISSFAYSISKDSLIIELTKQNKILSINLLSKDSIIKANNERLLVKVEYVEKYLNTRFDDYRGIASLILTLILLIVAGSWYNANRTAKKTAEEEFEKKFKSYHKRVKKIETDALELLEKIKNHESAARSIGGYVDSITKDADGKAVDVVGKALAKYLDSKLQVK